MAELKLLAFDMGASGGRAVLGRFDGERLEAEDLHRFEHTYNSAGPVWHWDVERMREEMALGFAACKRRAGEPACFGVDTWGVDYGLLDEDGRLLDVVRAYRYATDAEMEAAWERVDKETMFRRTGIAAMNFNTAYQLYRRVLEGDEALARARDLLLLPDLLGYFLTGEKASEYTNVTTTNLYNPLERDWDWELIGALGIPRRVFTPIQPAGSLRGRLLPAVAGALGLGRVPFAAVGTHDTASAVAAIPGQGDFAFCSSGTWSLFGTETPEPLLEREVYAANFSNEGTVQGGFRPLKNIMGLWIIQECRREWAQGGKPLAWEDITGAAAKAPPLRSLIDPDDLRFFSGGGMVGKIQAYCAETRQPVPEGLGPVARCVYESLALKYRWAIGRLAAIKGAPITTLNIVGGGSKNRLLNQLTADATGLPVLAGPAEGASLGNLLMQAMALGELKDIGELRQVVRRSCEPVRYDPHPAQGYDAAYERLCRLAGLRG